MGLAEVTRELATGAAVAQHGASTMTRADFETAAADDLREVGASGTVCHREHVWAILTERGARPRGGAGATALRCRALGADTYLLTHRLPQGARIQCRPSIWERADGHWRLVDHQGTIVGDPAA